MRILTDVVMTHTTNLHIRVPKPLSHSQSKLLFAYHELIPAGVRVLSAVREEYRACRWTEELLLVSDRETW
jgi:hypothetical protein